MLRRTLSSMACCLLLAATAHAAPLDPADVAKDAKWVVHADLQALADSKIVKKAGDKWPEKAEKMRNWMEQQFGVTPQEDLKSLTMFSNKYEKHSGVAILSADFDRRKVKESLEAKENVKKTKWEDLTLYTYTVSKHDKGHDDKKHSDDSTVNKDKTDKAELARDSSHGYGDHDHAPKSVTTVLVDRKTVVCATSPERAKWAIKVLEGDLPSLKKLGESKLTSAKTPDALVYAAAIDLNELPDAGGKLGILRQHKTICYLLEERGNTLHEEYTLTAVDEQIASKMKEAVQGLIALADVWSTDAQQFNKMLKEATVEQDGNKLCISWEGSPGEAITAIEQLARHADQWKKESQQR